jgi:transcriptional regulator with XRE-family HTH domain
MSEQMPLDNLDAFVPRQHHPMAPDGEVAAVQISQLGEQLRDFRVGADLTQEQVAEAFGWSQAKVARIEKAHVRPSGSDVRALLYQYGITDPAQVQALASQAVKNKKTARTTAYSEVISPNYRKHLEFEASADLLTLYDASMVPAPFRTEAYARRYEEVFNRMLRLTETQMALRAQLRRQQAAHLLGKYAPAMHVMVDEAVFWRPVGNEGQGAEHAYDEMRAIIRGLKRLHLAGRNQRPEDSHLNQNITVQVASPSSIHTLVKNGLPFSITGTGDQPVTSMCTEWSHGQTVWLGTSDSAAERLAAFQGASRILPGPDQTTNVLDRILDTIAARRYPAAPLDDPLAVSGTAAR